MKIAKKTIVLRNVRLSFHSLFKFSEYQGEIKDYYDASFIISKKDEANIKLINDEVNRICELSGYEVASDKAILKNGDVVDRKTGKLKHSARAEGCFYIKAKTKNKPNSDTKPNLVNRDKTIIMNDGTLYDGCYVNAAITIIYSDKYDCIAVVLNGIQFAKAGERFGEVFDVDSAFDDLSNDFEDDDGVPF